jgi:hypothetical protein
VRGGAKPQAENGNRGRSGAVLINVRSRAQCVSLFSTLVILFAIASPALGAPTTQPTIQESRPDFSSRYADSGWPATIVFNVDGSEIVKRQGYVAPGPMARMLQANIYDPTPGPSVQLQGLS